MLSAQPKNDPQLAAFAKEAQNSPVYMERQKFLMQTLCQRWLGYNLESRQFLTIEEGAFQNWLQQNQYSEQEIHLGQYGFEQWKRLLKPDERQNLLNQMVIAFHSTYKRQEALKRLNQWCSDKDFTKKELEAAKQALKQHQSATEAYSEPQPHEQPSEPSPDASSLDQIGIAIESIFREFNVQCRFMPPALESPRCLEFMFQKGAGTKISAFEPLASELLASPRLKSLDIKSAPAIQICPGVGVSVQILKPSFQPIMLENYLQWRTSKASDPLRFDLGINLRGEFMTLDLSRFPHFMTSSTTGGGKTNLQHDIVLSGGYRYSPAHLQFVLIDPKGNSFTPYVGLPHLWTGHHLIKEGVINTGVKALPKAPLIEADDIVKFFMVLLKAEASRRSRLFVKLEEKMRVRVPDLDTYNLYAPTPLPKIMPLIDETRPLVRMFDDIDSKFDTFMVEGAELFRVFGISFGCNTQYPKAVLLPGVRECLAHKLAGFMTTEDSSKAVLGDRSAMSLGDQGEFFYMCGGGEKVRFQSFYAGNERAADCFIYRAVDRIKSHYAGFKD